jgi:hypothetical protein
VSIVSLGEDLSKRIGRPPLWLEEIEKVLTEIQDPWRRRKALERGLLEVVGHMNEDLRNAELITQYKQIIKSMAEDIADAEQSLGDDDDDDDEIESPAGGTTVAAGYHPGHNVHKC